MRDPSHTSPILIYSSGLVYCSICAPTRFTAEMIVEEVNTIHPTGLGHGWTISKDPTFASGQPNPCECNDGTDRRHWLMEC